MSATAAAAERLPARLARWAARGRLGPASLSGIGFACGCCAVVWLTAGTPAGTLAGGTALIAGSLAQEAAARAARAGPAGARRAADGWLAAGCATAAEFAAYGALAAGAPAGQQRGLWPLAAGALILLAFRQMAALCRGPGAAAAGARPVLRAAWLLLTLPAPARAALITVTALAWGPRLTFLALLGWGTAATVAALAWPRRAVPPETGPAGPAPARREAGPGPAGLAACRGDGPIARRAGALVRGQLAPLPAALAGLAATGLLAAVGLRGLAGVVLLAPAAAMLLAAPGAAHPHDGRLDWLVPPALQAGQYIYLAALGFAAGVPGPLTFALPAVLALRHLDAGYRARHWPGWRPRYAGAGFGWEGRMLAAGLAAVLGVATFAYLVLTAYLGVLLGWICLSSWYSVQEGARG